MCWRTKTVSGHIKSHFSAILRTPSAFETFSPKFCRIADGSRLGDPRSSPEPSSLRASMHRLAVRLHTDAFSSSYLSYLCQGDTKARPDLDDTSASGEIFAKAVPFGEAMQIIAILPKGIIGSGHWTDLGSASGNA